MRRCELWVFVTIQLIYSVILLFEGYLCWRLYLDANAILQIRQFACRIS